MGVKKFKEKTVGEVLMGLLKSSGYQPLLNFKTVMAQDNVSIKLQEFGLDPRSISSL